jgi:thiamine kinase-like enzyme
LKSKRIASTGLGSPMRVEEAVERLWPGEAAEVEPLGGGITNHNFKVSVGGETLVLRIGGKGTALLGIDREHEHEAALLAAELGIAPGVACYTDGLLVTRFVEGEVGRADPEAVGALLRRLHGARPIASRFDSFRVVEAYAETAAGHGVTVPEAFGRAHEVARAIEARRAGTAPATCHNDLLAANFIDDGERLWVVDWEYAGMGDPFFDLANFAVNNGLDADGERVLLAAYGSADSRALTLMRFMSDFREAMWGVVQQAISELEFDFEAYAERHFERLERTAAEPRFRAALA